MTSRLWLPFALVAFVLVWAEVFPWMDSTAYTVGTAETRDAGSIVALVNSTDTIDAGNYDTFQSPRGTDYQVPANVVTAVTLIVASGTGDIGYGDDAVSNSASAPTNAVTVCTFIDGGDAWCPIPAGKLPWVRVDSAGSVQASGVVQ